MRSSSLGTVKKVVFSTCLFGAGVLLAGASKHERSPQLLRQVMGAVSQRFYAADSLDIDLQAARGLVKELGDPYSQLLSPKDLEAFGQSTLGRYAGVGMQILAVNDSIMVEEVYPGTPSMIGGFRRGDRLVSVNGKPVLGLQVAQVSEMLRGTPGSQVAVAARHREGGATFTATLARAVVRLPSVPFALMVGDSVAYVPLTGFPETAGGEVAAAMRDPRVQKAKGVILDIRGNPGGSVEEAVRVVNAFLPQGRPVVEMRERMGPVVLSTMANPVAPTVPLVVLQDGGSASASEIVTGALQDNDRALVVGTTSFGKGIAQSLIPLDGGYALKLTTSQWFTPVGRAIHRVRTHADSGARLVLSDTAAAADSLETSAKVASRPAYTSRGGRTLRGGGAITPDVVVPSDTLTTIELALRRELAAGAREQLATVLSRYALDLQPTVSPTFTVTQEWRDEFYRRLTAAGAKINREKWDAAPSYVDLLLEQRVAQVAFGQAEARRRELAGDTQFKTALDLLQQSESQDALLKTAVARRLGVKG